MQAATPDLTSLVSPRISALILTSPQLRRKLLPEGLITSPYEVLDYDATLTLEDPKGVRATFQRNQQIRFLQEGVSGILDHFGGDGVTLAFYQNDAGRLEDSFRDEGQRHLVIGFKRPMHRGETLGFEVVRKAMVGFTKEEEWLETRIDHPAKHLTRNIVFPKIRPCGRAMLHSEGAEVPLPISKLADGKTLVHFKVYQPRLDMPYVIRWCW